MLHRDILMVLHEGYNETNCRMRNTGSLSRNENVLKQNKMVDDEVYMQMTRKTKAVSADKGKGANREDNTIENYFGVLNDDMGIDEEEKNSFADSEGVASGQKGVVTLLSIVIQM